MRDLRKKQCRTSPLFLCEAKKSRYTKIVQKPRWYGGGSLAAESSRTEKWFRSAVTRPMRTAQVHVFKASSTEQGYVKTRVDYGLKLVYLVHHVVPKMIALRAKRGKQLRVEQRQKPGWRASVQAMWYSSLDEPCMISWKLVQETVWAPTWSASFRECNCDRETGRRWGSCQVKFYLQQNFIFNDIGLCFCWRPILFMFCAI